MSDQQKLSERMDAAKLVNDYGNYFCVSGLGIDWDGLRLKVKALESQHDALAKALQALVDKVLEELPERFAMQVTQNARESLATLERPAPADGGKA